MTPEIVRLSADCIEPYWREMARLWRNDAIRRERKGDLEALKRNLILGLSEVWLAWSDPPIDKGEFGGPRYAVGIVAAHTGKNRDLYVQFCCGRMLERWKRPLADAITQLCFEEQISRLHIFCRKGWKQYLGDCWSFPAEAVTLYTDPGALFTGAGEALRAIA